MDWRFRCTPAPAADGARTLETDFDDEDDSDRPRSVYLERRPDVRDADDDEDDDKKNPGPWMVQADEPHQKAEDPMGVQRPTDRDDGSDASELGEMLSELHEARLVTSPGRPKEVLLSDDPPHAGTHHHLPDQEHDDRAARYPEWNYRTGRYREAGATVQTLPTEPGSQSWVDCTLEEHRSMLQLIRRRFEMLQARRVVLRRQLDGEEIDFDTCVDAIADLRARRLTCPSGCTSGCRPAERSLAIMLLVDVSGSTDGWVSSMRRVIDVEREALLLVCIALREMGEPYAVHGILRARTAVTSRCRRDQGLRRNVRQRRCDPDRLAGTGTVHARRCGDPPCDGDADAATGKRPAAAAALGRQAQRHRRIRRAVRRRGHAPGSDRGAPAGPRTVLPDHRPTGRRLPAARIRRQPVRDAAKARNCCRPCCSTGCAGCWLQGRRAGGAVLSGNPRIALSSTGLTMSESDITRLIIDSPYKSPACGAPIWIFFMLPPD
ncbi:MAG: hypothetical protein U5K38_04545 [Woeseiaceae bacterium]|nr:hypothetical protein [Woeseiaceae bacterium]